jgi:hypothetical protein
MRLFSTLHPKHLTNNIKQAWLKGAYFTTDKLPQHRDASLSSCFGRYTTLHFFYYFMFSIHLEVFARGVYVTRFLLVHAFYLKPNQEGLICCLQRRVTFWRFWKNFVPLKNSIS